jgi:hypothetical protein
MNRYNLELKLANEIYRPNKQHGTRYISIKEGFDELVPSSFR